MRRWAARALTAWFLVVWSLQAGDAECGELVRIRRYIQESWTRLERSNTNLLESAADPKVIPAGGVILYVPAAESTARITRQLRRSLKPSEFQRVHVEQLRDSRMADLKPGLLYLPHPYVVPGGRFNEMYGWDSSFILLGLIDSGQLTLAKDMTDNCIYEVEHYGKVLNANRTYYITRSQPPFLTMMILAVYARTGDREWLRGTLHAIRKYYGYWTEEPHLTAETGLSRYYGGTAAPAPEVTAAELDSRGRTHYDRVREYYRMHQVSEYDVSRYYDLVAHRLTPLFYLADRAMRESGFDPSGRFGPFSAGILDYNPVDLNCLIYRMEMDTASIYTLIDQPREAAVWAERAVKRAATVNRLMWGEREGLYFDYDFQRRRQSTYRFITTFYPLWAGIATQAQPARVAANLAFFERAGGLQTSDRVTGDQWDAPFGWAPMQVISIQGLRRYGYQAEADRVGVEFLLMVLRDFAAHGTIKEKYNVVTARSDLEAGVRFGYASNEIGFAWTNAAFLVLYDALEPPAKAKFLARCQLRAKMDAPVTQVTHTVLLK